MLTQDSMDDRYVKKSGDTITGDLTVNGAIHSTSNSSIAFTPDDIVIDANMDVIIQANAGQLYISTRTYFDTGDDIILNSATYGEVTLAQYIKKVMS